jgi:hypothetical protein
MMTALLAPLAPLALVAIIVVHFPIMSALSVFGAELWIWFSISERRAKADDRLTLEEYLCTQL